MAANPNLRHLTKAQEHLLKARDALDSVDLRRCTKDQRATVRSAREGLSDVSTDVHATIRGEAPRAHA